LKSFKQVACELGRNSPLPASY